MNIKKLIGGIVLATTMTVGVGVGVGLGSTLNNENVTLEKAEAAKGDASAYYICGKISSITGSDWEDDAVSDMKQGESDLAVKENILLTSGDYFRFIPSADLPSNWDNTVGYSSIAGGTGAACFTAGDYNNLYCNVTGYYSLYLTSGKQIYVNLSSTNATYSYFCTGTEYSNLYIFGTNENPSGDPYKAWNGVSIYQAGGESAFSDIQVSFTVGNTDYNY